MLRLSWVLRNTSTAVIIINDTITEMYEPFVLPCSPASHHSCGMVPRINPMKIQVISGAFLSRSIPARPDSPINPAPAPIIKIPSISQYFFRLLRGFEIAAMSGRYIPKAAHSVPPLTPGSIAPRPTATPSANQSKLLRKLFLLPSIKPFSLHLNLRANFCAHINYIIILR